MNIETEITLEIVNAALEYLQGRNCPPTEIRRIDRRDTDLVFVEVFGLNNEPLRLRLEDGGDGWVVASMEGEIL